MGQLLIFKPRDRIVLARQSRPAGGAQILAFTGVRYDRNPPPPANRLDPSRRRKRF